MSAGNRLRRAVPFVGSLTDIRTPRPEVVLTYDDGPHPTGTRAVMQALADHGATATFFVLLSRARVHPEIIGEVTAAGHEIGLHGPDHRRLTSFSAREVLLRTGDAKRELEDLTGTSVRWFRPPYGAQRLSTWAAVRRAGLEVVLWSASTWDARHVSMEERLTHALTEVGRGSILLAHDAFASAADGVDDGDEPEVDRGALTSLLLSEFSRRGLRGTSLSQALQHGTPRRTALFSA